MLALAAKAATEFDSCPACTARAKDPPPHSCLAERAAYLRGLSEIDSAWARQWWWSTATAGQCPPPGDWDVWLSLRGRGAGKTWTGAWQVIEHAWAYGPAARIGIVTRTSRSTDTDTVTTKQSGILTISPRDFVPRFIPSRNTFVWPNGAEAQLFTAEEPKQLRGPQFTFVWVDELAAWEKLGEDGVTPEAWDQLNMGLRDKGGPCQVVATTTPLGTDFIRHLVDEDGVAVTTGTVFSNAQNLSEKWLRKQIRKYEGTRLGRQELYGEILEDVLGALWDARWFDVPGFRRPPPETMVRVVVAVDPAVTSNPNSDETGIVVVGIDGDGTYWVLADYSGSYSVETWAAIAVRAYHHHAADIVVAETNNGGDLVRVALEAVEDEGEVNFDKVTATRGKALRAEPIAALYERGLVRHSVMAPNGLAKLEKQLTSWSPVLAATQNKNARSPDRLDALVWGMTELVEGDGAEQGPGGVYGAEMPFDEQPLG